MLTDLKSKIEESHGNLEVLWQSVKEAEDRIPLICAQGDLSQVQTAQSVGNAYGDFANTILAFRLYPAATGLLIKLWHALGLYQREHGGEQHVYRAGIAMYLGMLYQTYNEPGAAIWWLLHAHADDLLTQAGKGGGAAQDLLRLAFGVSEEALDDMAHCTDYEDTTIYSRYAEHAVVQFSKNPQHSHLFSHPTSLTEFPIGQAYARTVLDTIDELFQVPQDKMINNEKGRLLEDLGRYLLLLLAGWVPISNMISIGESGETDLIARYTREPESISTAHGRAILAECKNWEKPVPVEQVGYFLYRMHLAHVQLGIMFARSDITGVHAQHPFGENAEALLNRAFHEDEMVCVVITTKDMTDLAYGRSTLWSLIQAGIERRRFGYPRQNAAR